MPRNGPGPTLRDRRRPSPFSGLCMPEGGVMHCPPPLPHPGGARRPYPSPNHRSFRDMCSRPMSPGTPCTPPCYALMNAPHYMRRPGDQIYDRDSPEKSGGDEWEDRRRSPNFRRTPGASRPPRSKGGPGGNGCPPRPPYPGYLMTWGENNCQNNHKGAFYQPATSPASNRMLHASDLCGGGSGSPPGRGGGGDASFNEDEVAGEGKTFPGSTVELRVNNLDYNISAREWKKILVAEFVEHVKVLDAYIQTQADNTNVGYIRLGSIDEARFAISKLHRKKVGYKRIHVSLVDDTNSSSPNTKAEVVGLLKEVSDNSLPLFKFIDMFEKRFHRGISVSELYRMRTSIQIEDTEGSGRTVSLPPMPSSPVQDSTIEDEENEVKLS